jgi:hypothetical protein
MTRAVELNGLTKAVGELAGERASALRACAAWPSGASLWSRRRGGCDDGG